MEQDLLQTAEDAARLGGRVLESWAERFTVSEKSRHNLVTEADVASQEAIYDLIRSRFPDHDFLGEEGLSHVGGQSPFRWIIDPLDGTSNYVHRFPYYAVSIGLERAGELLLGVIYDPNRDEMFSAVAGAGATLNNRPIATTTVDSLSRAMVVASLPVNAKPTDHAVSLFLKVLPRAQAVQRTGSAALNLAYVASGRIDAFWSKSLKAWDMAAGVILVREAGGCVTRIDGGELDLHVPDMLSSNGTQVHNELQHLLSQPL